ncbi:ABC transporter permease [Desulforamulus ruminis]|uniref:Binding-protein-dependent transport systems inner membrane component n=1 Tax=Desulforamulus ruminis (strain ATCC 23193 / DSM 2154 / NCIMB 8452 / DL) TaxID=696281 RepID=F6DUZ7_DESRL|nr:ABC transporter permease [Desulforamulus ruminis]AEG61394.1 binding-protein-dependent transport systems inner membrane component [Desulforamulus ruminis DSM 2154]
MVEITSLAMEHLWLSASGVFIAALIGIPMGILLLQVRSLAEPVLGLIDMLQTIPSLALLAIALYYFGLGNGSLVAALVVYSLLPIVRNTYLGLKGVEANLIEAGRGMGMTRLQLLWQVQLPIALPVMLSGFRVAMVTAIGIATIGTLIGAGGLGSPIWRGIQLADNAMILSAAIPAALLAVLSDLLLSTLEKITVPKGLRARGST